MFVYYVAALLSLGLTVSICYLYKMRFQRRLADGKVTVSADRDPRDFTDGRYDLLWKILSAVLICLFFARYLGGNFAIKETVGLNIHSPFGTLGVFQTLIATIVLWLTFSAGIMMVTYPYFYKPIWILTTIVKYFVSAVYLLALITLPYVTRAMDGNLAYSVYWRDVLYSLEIGIGGGYALFLLLTDVRNRKDGRVIPKAFAMFAAMVIVTMPTYVPQVLVGVKIANFNLLDFNVPHRIALYLALVLPIMLHFCVHKYEYEERRYALLFVALGTMISYSSGYTFKTFITVSSWPLHLCNLAMFIVPLCLVFKWEKLYYFTLFINVLGALFAMLMPNYSEGLTLLEWENVEFWLNHYCAFFMPILMMSLRIFKRPKIKEYLGSLVAFAGYFLVVLVTNAWLTGIGKESDFFFINSDFIAEKAGKWAENLRNVTSSITVGGVTMTFYPIYQILFFIAYVFMSLGVWFIYEEFFELTDLYAEMTRRNAKIKADRIALAVAMGGRSIKEPVNMEGQDKLILKNFSKRYSTSDVYAVKEANLEVHGGEIFGFLGPNGAGKSTIIKSIVGIQSITDGAIEVCGYDVEKQSVEAKMQTGFVPDHYALYENLTGREYVNYIADLYGVSKEDRTARIEEYIERFHLHGAIDNRIRTYSHGMKQKITIMSALVHNPKLWILDEPLTGLDPESIFQVKECMKAHAAKGNIVFFSSHIIDVVERICDRIAIIKKGNILCCKTIKEIEDSGEALEDFYMNMIGETVHD